MSKGNTLFSYFSKKPKPPKADNNEETKCSDILSPTTNGNAAISNSKQNQQPVKPKLAKDPAVSACPFSPMDLVWSKLEGYPWWPSMVCNHPKTKKHVKEERKQRLVHVQFFDDPPTRGWVKEKFTKPFTGSDCKDYEVGGQFFSPNPQVRKGVESADEALKMAAEDRLKLVVAMDSSSEDEAEDEEEDMDVEEQSDEELDSSSKENAESPKKKSPQKGVSRPTRSSRQPKKKRRRIMVASDSDDPDSTDEFKPKKNEEESDEDDSDVSSGVDEDEISDIESGSDPETPVKKRKRDQSSKPKAASKPSTPSISSFMSPGPSKNESKTTTTTPSVSTKTKSKLSMFSAPEAVGADNSDSGRTFPHLSHEFLQPDKIRDGEKRLKCDNPDYDPHTLYIPESFLAKQTPGMRQWWDLKAKFYDTILFFKMGKFYELFHMDAVIGVNELGLIYMRGDHAHSGFPEIAYGRYAESLIQKGYKVARIEQTETPDMAAERCRKMSRSTKFDKVVRREVCSVQSKGTKRYSFIDGHSSDTSHVYLLAVCEKLDVETVSGKTYGVCFVDTSIGKFMLGQFEDDRHSSRLRTLLSHYPAAQVLTERGKLSDKTSALLINNLPSVIHEPLKAGTEFWDSTKTLKTLSESDYFTKGKEETTEEWPETLKKMRAEGDALGHTAGEGYEMALSSLGAVIWYLQRCLMDEELLSMCNFDLYVPLDLERARRSVDQPDSDSLPAFLMGKEKMVLDGVTLANLDILVNVNTGTTEGTLLERMDNCCTAFGKRLFKQWLCAPLCNPSAINDRLNAIEDLMAVPEVTAEVTELLKKMPDLERLLSKIHTLGSANRSKNHPDGRAVFFEDVAYSKRKIEDFLATLGGFQNAVVLIKKFQSRKDEFKSKFLQRAVSIAEGEEKGSFPELSEELAFFAKAFDHEKAKREGVIKPSKGVDEDYDSSLDDIRSITQDLQTYLDQQKKRIGCRTIVYWGTAKNRFQMEIPENAVRHIPDEYEVASSKKGYKRYRTPHIEDKLAEITDAEDRRDAALKDIMRRIFFTFDKSYHKWEAAVQCLSVIDVLINLSQFSRQSDGAMCRPEVMLPTKGIQPHLEIHEGWHPCISKTFSGGDFIPNDLFVGILDDKSDGDPAEAEKEALSRVVLVTGPNMGGKSTLMRQVGIITIMAQLGCYVPAEKCRLTPVDRVFTRLGASDRIMAGESTFFVELSETSSILQHATEHSLVLLDELGRGTATYDGTAIACAVVNELSQNIKCRTLFSTHYHSLVEEFSYDPNVKLGHMACMVENENEEDPTQETITFLYKFVRGSCPKSYGFNAARLANIPDEIISEAHKKAQEFQQNSDQIRHFRSLCDMKSAEDKIREFKDLIQVK